MSDWRQFYPRHVGPSRVVNDALPASSTTPLLSNVVKTVADFPDPVANVITLPADTAWYLDAFVDLGPNRLVCAGPVTIRGSSSETSGLSGSVNGPLLSSNFTLALLHFTFEATGIKCLELEGGTTAALDWRGINFLDTSDVGTINNPDNFIFETGSFLNSSNMIIGGSIRTGSMFQSLFSGNNAATPIIKIADGTTISRRFRLFYSSVFSPALSLGFVVGAGVVIPDESLILNYVNFSGPGTRLSGITSSDNTTLFTFNNGVGNTASIGEAYVTTPAATVIPDTVTYVPVAGGLTAGTNQSKWTQSSPARLTCNAGIERKYFLKALGSFTTGNNNQVQIGFYYSGTGAMIPLSLVISTANGAGRSEAVCVHAVADLLNGQFVEVRCRNLTAANNITFDTLSMVVTEI